MMELKPCPFCGGEARICHKTGFGEWSYVECEKCRCTTGNFMKSFTHSSDDKAADAWNRRVTDGTERKAD